MDRVTDATNKTVVWRAKSTDRWGNTVGFTEGNIGVNYSYDPVTGLVTDISAQRNGQPLFGQASSWTATGNLDWRTDTTLNLKEEFTYDRFNRLASATSTPITGLVSFFSDDFLYDSNGNITQKDRVGRYEYRSDSPYAVTEIGPDMPDYEHFQNQTVTYTPFDKIYSVSQNGNSLSVSYDIDRQRVLQSFNNGTTTHTKRYFTPLYETVTENGVTKKLHYLTAANGLFAIFVGTANGGTMYYTLKDHQGSLAATIHVNTMERLSYDPWGRRRNTTNFGYGNVTYTFDRGYTLHEHYDEFDLINMNGRQRYFTN